MSFFSWTKVVVHNSIVLLIIYLFWFLLFKILLETLHFYVQTFSERQINVVARKLQWRPMLWIILKYYSCAKLSCWCYLLVYLYNFFQPNHPYNFKWASVAGRISLPSAIMAKERSAFLTNSTDWVPPAGT
jgi:hypothetical protein